MNPPAVQGRLKQIAADPVKPERRSTDYLQRFVESEVRQWALVIKGAGVTPE